MHNSYHIGIDLGGTHMRAGIVKGDNLSELVSRPLNRDAVFEEVLQELYDLIDPLLDREPVSIGIGVPGLVDTASGIVYDVVNIPSWKEISLRQIMEDRYRVPVYIENDANCFAVGERYYGKGKGHDCLIGLTIGTGLGSGIIINSKLYAGKNGGAGEFGMIDYLDKYYEYYASGQFFQNVYQMDGTLVYKNAAAGDAAAIKMYEEFGTHLGNAIKTILYAFDIPLIILGGSVRHAFPYFSKTMWRQIRASAFQRSTENLRIETSELANSGILGAAALYRDPEK